MQKTAGQIADAVLEKLAVSRALAQKALWSKKLPDVLMSSMDDATRASTIRAILKAHPRTAARAGEKNLSPKYWKDRVKSLDKALQG